MSSEPCVHPAMSRWEFDPSAMRYSRRCVRCGRPMVTMTQRELDETPADDVPAALEMHVGNRHRRTS